MTVRHTRGLRYHRRTQGHRFEELETRIALSATPPAVTDVSVAGSGWSSAFYDYLENNGLGSDGYSIPVGSSAQEAPLSWTGVDQIRLTFSEDVLINEADLSLSGVNQASLAFSDFDYYPEDRLAVWTLEAPLADDRYRIDLDSDGIDPVTDLDGNLLDGEWTDSTSVYTSGDGTAGGDFEFSLRVLGGDALGIDLLEYNNLFEIYNRTGQGVSDPFYAPKADVDGDGLIEQSDWEVVWSNMVASTPVGTPVGATSDAPTTTGFDPFAITDDTIDFALSLHAAFDDAEDADSQLSYSIRSNTDPSLFDQVSIDQLNGQLVLNSAAGVSGRSRITVTATDQSGLQTDATLTVDVDRQNIVPTLTAATTDGGGGLWLVEGWVTDADDDEDDMYVIMEGLRSARVSVSETGYFSYAVLLDPEEGGSIKLFTSDETESSNEVYLEIGWV